MGSIAAASTWWLVEEYRTLGEYLGEATHPQLVAIEEELIARAVCPRCGKESLQAFEAGRRDLDVYAVCSECSWSKQIA